LNPTVNKFPAILMLEDGTYFTGTSIGKIGTTTGEICFNTGMTGYQEVFTDPSYYGQMLITTNVHVGNYGIHPTEEESNGIKISGLVCKSFNIPYSRKQSDQSIQEYFASNNLIGISDVDTRQIVRHIRDKGAMNAIISSELKDIDVLRSELASVPSMAGLELSSKVSTKQTYFVGSDVASNRIAVLDLGVKKNILHCLAERDCHLAVFNCKSSVEEMLKFQPNGFMISNGPGDPSVMEYAVETVKQMLETGIPLFGICLGHQILSESQGLKTFKMHNGHRGLNHPVKNLLTGRSEITSQNHGFAVSIDEVNNHKEVELTHVNLNDGTVEGIRLKDKKAFSVQYHPEASPGPHDSRYLFDDFINMIHS